MKKHYIYLIAITLFAPQTIFNQQMKNTPTPQPRLQFSPSTEAFLTIFDPHFATFQRDPTLDPSTPSTPQIPQNSTTTLQTIIEITPHRPPYQMCSFRN